MSKTAIFLGIIFLGVGVAIGWYRNTLILATQQMSQNPMIILEWIKAMPVAFWTGLIGIVGAVGATILGLASKANQFKQHVTQKANQDVDVLKQDVTQLQTKNVALETQLSNTTTKYSTDLAKISENYVKLQDEATELKATCDQVTAERNHLASQVISLQKRNRELEQRVGYVK